MRMIKNGEVKMIFPDSRIKINSDKTVSMGGQFFYSSQPEKRDEIIALVKAKKEVPLEYFCRIDTEVHGATIVLDRDWPTHPLNLAAIEADKVREVEEAKRPLLAQIAEVLAAVMTA